MFKPGDFVILINDKNKPYMGVKPKYNNIKWLTKGKIYKVLEPTNPYNADILITTDNGIKKHYSPRRFKKIDRKEKINKIINKINKNELFEKNNY